MKKFIFAISCLCYLAAASGIVVNSHYCMKKLVSVHLFGEKSDVCGKCGMDMRGNSGCCHDEVKIEKLSVDQQKHLVTYFEIAAPVAVIVQPSSFIVSPLYAVLEQRHFHNHSPPLLGQDDIYLRNNVFRI